MTGWQPLEAVTEEHFATPEPFATLTGLEQTFLTASRAALRYHFTNRARTQGPPGKLEDWKLVYGTPGRIVELTVPFLKPQGRLVAWKGAAMDLELSAAGRAIELLGATVDRLQEYFLGDLRRTLAGDEV